MICKTLVRPKSGSSIIDIIVHLFALGTTLYLRAESRIDQPESFKMLFKDVSNRLVYTNKASERRDAKHNAGAIFSRSSDEYYNERPS